MFYMRVFMVIVINLFTEVRPWAVSRAPSLFVSSFNSQLFLPDVKNRNLNERCRVKMSGKIRLWGGGLARAGGKKWLSSCASIHRLSELERKHIHFKYMFHGLWCLAGLDAETSLFTEQQWMKSITTHGELWNIQNTGGSLMDVENLAAMIKNRGV